MKTKFTVFQVHTQQYVPDSQGRMMPNPQAASFQPKEFPTHIEAEAFIENYLKIFDGELQMTNSYIKGE